MDYLKLIEAKESELSTMHGRMDRDANKFQSAPFTMYKSDGRTKVDHVYNVTLLDAAQFLDKAVAKLTAVKRQAVVKGKKLSSDQSSVIEAFLADLQFEIDARLIAKGECDSFTQHSELVCARGPIAEQVMMRFDPTTSEFVPDSRPLDARWFLWDFTDGNINWGRLKTKRSKAAILAEYGIEIKGDDAYVEDFWDSEIEAIYVDKKLVKLLRNEYGEPPYVIAFPSTSSALKIENSIERLGDSIMHSLRTSDGQYLFDEKNFVASIVKTLAVKAITPDLQFPTGEALPDDKPEYQALPQERPHGDGAMIQVKQPAQLVPREDMTQALQTYAQMINEQLDRGTFSALSHGILELPLPAAGIAQLMGANDDLLLPRLNCLASLRQSAAKMAIRQIKKLGEPIQLGEEGSKRSYSPADLEGDYTVKFRFFTASREQMVGAAAIAQQVAPYMSAETIQDEVLQIQDPAAERAKMAEERSKKAIPALDLYEQMRGHIKAQEATDDEAEKAEHDIQARFILERIVSIVKQQRASESQPMPVNLEQAAKVATPGAPGMAIPPGAGGQMGVK